ncbi:MAG: AraC family transcriptional regulator [Eggerthella sp.]|nr:AraC family transcriptional regulator [Eggerthella sp.]
MNESCTIKPLPLFKGERRTYCGILQPFADHAHDHYVFGIVREGERELVLNGELLHIKKDDILVFNPGDAHGCTQVSEGPFAYDSFTVATETLDDERFCFPSNTDDLPREQLEEVFSLLDRHREEEALEEFVAFEQTLVTKPDANPPNPKHEEAAVRLYAHMLGHLAKRVCVEAFAENEGISAYALIRAYRRMFSLTPVQHQLALRVDAACELLANGAHASDAAAELGFSDQAHLTREFKKRIGCTPGSYAAMRKTSEGQE